jgi:hypothetical protein
MDLMSGFCSQTVKRTFAVPHTTAHESNATDDVKSAICTERLVKPT